MATGARRGRWTTGSERTPPTSPHTHPADGGPWDLVVGHSLGGAASVVASADHPDWTRRLVLIDPGIVVMQRDADIVRTSQERAFADNRIAVVRDEHPHWHPHDLELKVDAVARASRWAVEQTSVQNRPWDVRDAAARLTVPTHVLGADPQGVQPLHRRDRRGGAGREPAHHDVDRAGRGALAAPRQARGDARPAARRRCAD